ncbi:type II toxin-antitoxin system VapC family toxin [Spirochaeta dissipatitropha]
MSVYVDSGVLIKLYIREPNSNMAIDLIQQHSVIHINRLQELEIRNTFHALEGRGGINSIQRTAAEHYLELDCAEGRLHRTALDWSAVFQSAMEFSRNFTSDTLARSLDIMHVAAAVYNHCTLFITGDTRQAQFARLCGLQVSTL